MPINPCKLLHTRFAAFIRTLARLADTTTAGL